VYRRRRLTVLLAVVVAAVLGLELVVGPSDERARHGAELERIEIDSEAVGQELPVEVVVPQGAEGSSRPMLVFLHGRGDDGERSNLNEEMYEALDGQGEDAPVVAFPNGGQHSYWHDRADAAWASYVVAEVIPRVADQFGADPNRVAIGGISMGGFGALDIARLHPGRFCAVGAHSPAVWRNGADSAAGAFDDLSDFERHDLLETAQSAPAPYLGAPLWLDSGDRDPFRPGIDAFAEALETAGAPITFRIWPGEHEGEYWRSHWAQYMRFYARALRRCG
jgi:S-formylglutathione hydrolase FrmB